MSTTRREALLRGLFGAGLWGLRSLATGLPISFLMNPARADTCALDQTQAQFLIMSTSWAGDPVNANAPLTYDFAATSQPIQHPTPADMSMDMTAATINGKSYNMARPWAELINSTDPTINVAGRIAFIHHTTLNDAHTAQGKVQRLQGSLPRQEMLVSYLAKQLAPCLGTIQSEPVMVGATVPAEALTYAGRTLPNLKPTSLAKTLLNLPGPLTQLQSLRDQDLNRMNALIKQSGNTAQKAYLDRLATSQSQARAISQTLLSNLSTIADDGPKGQILAATALVAMKVSPVVSLHLPFGGDNHADPEFAIEASQTVASVSPTDTTITTMTPPPLQTGIPYLMQKLTELNIRDQATFLLMNVFGRTLANPKLMRSGRDHWGNHHVTVLIGKPVKAGVFGGLALSGSEYKATSIDSVTGAGGTGAGGTGGDIKADDSLYAVGKTIGALVGVPAATLDQDIPQKVIQAALA